MTQAVSRPGPPATGAGEDPAAVTPGGRPGWLRLPRGASFLVMLVVVGMALAVGSGAFAGGTPTPAQRATAIEDTIRCPSCEDLSVAQSSASTAIAVRHLVERMVRQGATDARIKAALVARYGTGILLVPPASGLGVLVYVLPAAAGAGALGVVGVLFWRRSRALARWADE